MFSKACEIASNFTLPVIASMRKFNKSVNCSNGAFVILNKDGWIVTVAHLLEPNAKFINDQKEIDEYKKHELSIDNNPAFSEKIKRREKNKFKVDQNWITDISYWWGVDGVKIDKVVINPFVDLAIGQLYPFDPTNISIYPILKNPKNIKVGTSLCKLGFPFHNIHATFDENTHNFRLAPNTIPIPRFPLEGMYTRNQILVDSNNPQIQTKFIETSSPGLRGQSGGPIFDIHGFVWAIQSRTSSLELGFKPQVKRNNKIVEENQFLNVGLGVHPEILVSFLQQNNVDFQLSED